MRTDLEDKQQDEGSGFPEREKPSIPLTPSERLESDKIFQQYYGADAKKDGIKPSTIKKNDDLTDSSVLGGSQDSEAAGLAARGVSNNLNFTGGKLAGKDKNKVSGGGFAKKRIRIAIIAGLLSIVFSIIGFFAVLPLKINNLIANVEKKYFAAAEEAVEQRTERFFADYVRRHVLPQLGGDCSSTRISRTCSVKVDGASGPTRLYRAWADARLEQKLSERHGITFERSGNTFNMDVRGERVDITGFANGQVELRDVGRNEVRTAWKEAMKRETRVTRVLYHFKVGRLLERKYGIKRCIIACKHRDNFADWGDSKGRAAKAWLLKRVLAPRDEMLSIAFECIFISDCGGSANDHGDDHERRDRFQERVSIELARLSRSYGRDYTREGVERMLRELDEVEAEGRSNGYQRYIMRKILQKVFKQSTAETVSNMAVRSIPIVGWISTADILTTLARNAGPAVRKYRYVVNSAAMIQLYSMYKTVDDERKVGNIDAQMFGSFIEELGDNTNKGETAELSPLYNEVINGPGRAGYGTSLFGATAFAEGEQKKPTCDNGRPYPDGELLCSEEKLTDSTAAAAFIESISDNGVLAVAQPIASTLGAPIRAVFGPLDTLIGFITELPLVRDLVSLVAKLAQLLEPFMKSVLEILIPVPISHEMSGVRTANMIIGGGNAAGQEFAQYGLGGAVLSDEQITAIRNKRAVEDTTRFANLPLKDRLFSTNETRSLVSQIAVTVPSSGGGLASSFLSINPLKNISSIFAPKKVSAEAVPTKDPFGIVQYGYALDDPVLYADPEKYTPEYCAQEMAAWRDSFVVDDNTGMNVHYVTSPCILEEAAIASAGGYFDDSLIPTKDKIVQSLGSNYAPTPPGECPNNPVPESETVNAEGIKVHKCIEANTRELVLAARADGFSSFGGSGWRDTEKQVELRQINGCPDIYNSPAESCTVPTARPGSSMHERGLAIDVACDGATIGSSSRCFSWLQANAERFGFYNLPSEPWHWSVNGR